MQVKKNEILIPSKGPQEQLVNANNFCLIGVELMCCVHNHTQTQISIHCRNTIRYCRHLYISGGSYNVFI